MSPGALDEKIRAKCQSGCAPLLEEGETIRVAVWGSTVPFVPYSPVGLILVPYTMQKLRIAAATDRNIYVFQSKLGSSFTAKSVLAKGPVGGCTAIAALDTRSRRASVLLGPAPLTLTIEGEKLYVIRSRAMLAIVQAIVASATGAEAA
jgi:hypothetical protein